MRSITHPGPIHAQRVECVPARLHPVDVRLQAGETLLQGLCAAAREAQVASAVFSFDAGSFAPLTYVMPALTQSPDHVAHYSETFTSRGSARIESGSITLGSKDGQPMAHCHAIWKEPDGSRHSGHLFATDSRVDREARLRGWMIEGAAFDVAPDAETNFSLFQVAGPGAAPAAANGLVVRVRPNQDICHALEALCAERGIRRARVRGGVGSLIGIAFADGRAIEAHITEVFVRQGTIEPGAGGRLEAALDIGAVAYTGDIGQGVIARGHNAVLITFELVLEVLEREHATGGAA